MDEPTISLSRGYEKRVLIMEFESLYSHRFAIEILKSVPELSTLWSEILQAVSEVSEDEVASVHNDINNSGEITKSLSKAINFLLDDRLTKLDWTPQTNLFSALGYNGKNESAWTLDFSKSVSRPDGSISGLAIEVAFNHGEAAAWNLMKPVLAAEVNYLPKQVDIGEGVGIVIVASQGLKEKGAFDGAVGTYDRYVKHLRAMRTHLTTPLLIASIAPPKNYFVKPVKVEGSRSKRGEIVYY